MSNTPKKIFLDQYQPPAFKVETIALRFELGDDITKVTSHVSYHRNPLNKQSPTSLILDGHDMELVSIKMNDTTLSSTHYRVGEEHLEIFKVPDQFELEIVTHIKPQENTALEGLYQSGGMFCTQCEAEGFRRITYYLDRPDVMARFSTTIVADKKKFPVLLSNGNLIDRGEYHDGRHWVKWNDPFPKPCYLFALVGGRLVSQHDTFVTRSGRNVSLQIFVEPGNESKCDHALVSLKKAMKWDEDVYGREYDLDIYMIVAVDDFNMGAMENKGLNIFNSACVLANPQTATDYDYDNIESIIAHEYFHNWSGNRVTCRDWFQLSLKEGFTVFRDQQFTEDQLSRSVKRISDVNVLRTAQFSEDGGPMAHPVRPDSYIEINNFYTVTVYNKGAEVVRMQHTLLGEAGFRKGTDLYFSRHDGHAVTTDDFVQAMEDANEFDFTQFKRWYSQAGTPVLDVSDQYDAAKKQYQLTIKQSCPPTPGQEKKQAFFIPFEIGLLDKSGNDIPLVMEKNDQRVLHGKVLVVDQSTQSFVFNNVANKPVPSLLRHFSAPVKVNYDYSDDELCFLMAHDGDAFNRWDASQRLSVRVINRLIEAIENGKKLAIENDYIEAFRRIINDRQLDNLLKTQALTLPNEIYLAEMQPVVDPDVIHQARLHVMKALALALNDEFEEHYDRFEVEGSYQFNATDMGARSLRNQCLFYLLRTNDPTANQVAAKQLYDADNMTDALGALNALVHNECAERGEALQWFYDKWWHDALVLDKWFSIQAGSDVSSVIRDVRELTKHKSFEIRNPNKVRSVIGSFAMRNPAHFHHASGEGYRFVADHIIQLSHINPQIAARLASAFNQWKRYEPKRQQMMKTELQRVASEPKLPRDVFEIVNKALGTV